MSLFEQVSHHPSCRIPGPPVILQAESERNLPFDQFLACPHFLEQRWVANNPSRILDLTARLIQSCYDADNRSLHNVGQVGDTIKGHAASPLVHDLDHAKAGLAHKVVRVVGR